MPSPKAKVTALHCMYCTKRAMASWLIPLGVSPDKLCRYDQTLHHKIVNDQTVDLVLYILRRFQITVSSILNCNFIREFINTFVFALLLQSYQSFFLLMWGYYIKILIFSSDSRYWRSMSVDHSGLQRLVENVSQKQKQNFLLLDFTS